MATLADVQRAAMASPGATQVTLWGRLDVYKVRGKVFASCGEHEGLSFKATPIAYEVLTRDGPGRPAPGFIRGAWVNIPLSRLDPGEAMGWIETSYRLAIARLSKMARAELGLS
ncbi:MAG TPA: MmcQ/YjbR family DNA-binding protein [Phenylobacterium sp.]